MKNILDIYLYLLPLATQIIIIGVFLYRLKYVNTYGLTLWGINLMLEIGFTVLMGLMARLLNISDMYIYSLNENLFFIINLGTILLLFAKFKGMDRKILIGVFGTFLAVWLMEFYLQFVKSKMIEPLYYSAIFQRLIITGLALWYLSDLFSKSKIAVSQIPFFWIILGWFTYYFFSQTAFIPETAEASIHDLKGWKFYEYILYCVSSFVAFIFYGIGFWKTKDWFLKNSKQYYDTNFL